MIKVKICGITSLSDALKAVEFGADAIGFVLAESPREVSLAGLKKISRALPPFISRVGVFVNEKVSLVKKFLENGLIDYAQLHGDEGIAYCKSLPLERVIKAVRPQNLTDIKKSKLFKNAGAILIDAFEAERRGGTGKAADWGLALQAKKIGPPVILSGGLTINNVKQGILKGRPYAVDVSSGVEKSPGKKDYRLLRIFIERAKGIK